MAKVYMLTDADFQRLHGMLARDPDHGEKGHSSQHLSQQERDGHRRAYRFFNYQVLAWIDEVTK